jgi:hypothetical protein
MIIPYKNRLLNPDKPVKVYRCLNRKGHVFSIQQNGYVVGHTTDVVINNAVFKINEKGKKRAIEEKVRNVHAFIVGNVEKTCSGNGELKKISYNPFSDMGFYYISTQKEVEDIVDCVKINQDGVFCLIK